MVRTIDEWSAPIFTIGSCVLLASLGTPARPRPHPAAATADPGPETEAAAAAPPGTAGDGGTATAAAEAAAGPPLGKKPVEQGFM